ncbi:MAG: AAA family ATPase [Christensenellales bacterium]|jgi:hypothetical protein
MQITKKLPLFIVTGASGVGKTSVCNVLFKNETNYIVLDGDLLWNDSFDTPENGFHSFRETWLKLCANISQCGLPVVLCGAGVPEQFESCQARKLFSAIHYAAVTCSDSELSRRMKISRGINDERWLNDSLDFNGWLIENAGNTQPPTEIFDTTHQSLEETAALLEGWIIKKLKD